MDHITISEQPAEHAVCPCCRRCPVCGHYPPASIEPVALPPPAAPTAPWPSVPGTTTWPFRPFVPASPGLPYEPALPSIFPLGRWTQTTWPDSPGWTWTITTTKVGG